MRNRLHGSSGLRGVGSADYRVAYVFETAGWRNPQSALTRPASLGCRVDLQNDKKSPLACCVQYLGTAAVIGRLIGTWPRHCLERLGTFEGSTASCRRQQCLSTLSFLGGARE